MSQPRFWSERVRWAYTGGAALTLAAAWQRGGLEKFLLLAAPIWLAPLAAYDLGRRQVPHLACVAGPCLLALGFAAVRGGWALAALALVSLTISERWRRPAREQRVLLALGLFAGAGLLAAVPVAMFTGAAAIVSFWLMFELNWWAGADALAAITLALLWPTPSLVSAIAAAQIAWAFLRRTPWRRPRPLTAAELAMAGQPGLPALALAASLHLVFRFGF